MPVVFGSRDSVIFSRNVMCIDERDRQREGGERKWIKGWKNSKIKITKTERRANGVREKKYGLRECCGKINRLKETNGEKL